MGVESILRRHSPAHDGIEEGFPLASIETEDLLIRSRCRVCNLYSQRHSRATSATACVDVDLSVGYSRTCIKALVNFMVYAVGCLYTSVLICIGGTGRSYKCLNHVIHTSILPPTRASKGGRGLSFSFFSCRRDCLRPPTKNTTTVRHEKLTL